MLTRRLIVPVGEYVTYAQAPEGSGLSMKCSQCGNVTIEPMTNEPLMASVGSVVLYAIRHQHAKS